MSTKLLLVMLLGRVLAAHEIGTTRVTATLGARTYDIEIVTDAAALAEKLAPAPLSALPKRVKIAFGGTEVTPAVSGSFATIHLPGAIPPNPGPFTWTYG